MKYRNDLHYNSFRNISLLTIINLVVYLLVLLLDILVWILKMNNLLSINNPQLFVLLLCILSSITLLHYKRHKYFDLDKDYLIYNFLKTNNCSNYISAIFHTSFTL